jgi:hypothetical protein
VTGDPAVSHLPAGRWHNFVPAERAEQVAVPLWLTKRGVLVRAAKPRGRP